MDYNFREVEKKWQSDWSRNKVFKAEIDLSRPKFYVLDMFPYPSGAGLHVGHPLGYIASDIYSRYKRLKGFNVLHPMGYDAYGLPAEQYAIQTGTHPAITTEKNIARYREQLDKLGFSFDWDREVRTSEPSYYKWTQWTFIQLFNSWYNKTTDKADSIQNLLKSFETEGNAGINAACSEGTPLFTADDLKSWTEKQQQELLMNYRLAYLADTLVNWCPALGTVLANDEVSEGFSVRGGHPVERKKMKQWLLRITAYADRLLQGFDTIDWSDSLKEIQKNWIGRSEGGSMRFKVTSLPLTPSGGGGTYVPLTPSNGGGTSREDLGSVVEERSSKRYGYMTADVSAYSYLNENAHTLKKDSTEAEKIIWERLRGKKINYKFRRQHIIGRYIVDFVCLSKKTIIEIDGPIHDFQKEYDEVRTANLKSLGFEVIRFKNEEVFKDTDKVINEILNLLKSKVLPTGEDLGGATTATEIEVFTTRPDTIFGATFLVLAPEHELVETITTPEFRDRVEAYVKWTKNRSERERMTEVKKVSGEFTGAYAENPFTGILIPIWIADYVLMGYGTGAIMAVPAHDSRDFAFAKHFNLPVVQVVNRPGHEPTDPDTWEESYDSKEGVMINSGLITGMNVKEAISAIILETEYLEIGKGKINYRLRDAIFSRQRYWGEPFPVYYRDGMPYMLPEDQLPLELPEVDAYLPTENGEPPLARAKNWVTAEGYPLETNTMPGFAGSSGYYLRYMDPRNDKEYFSKEAVSYWQNVDLYIGGAEHATGHLIYARFWNKFLYDLGYSVCQEPFKKLINQGMILGVSMVAKVVNMFKDGDRIGYILPSKIDALESLFDKNLTPIQRVRLPIDFIDLKTNRLYAESLNEIKKAYTQFKNLRISTLKNIEEILSILELNNIIQLTENDKSQFHADYVELLPEVEKMSKTYLNVINPDDLIEKYGADTLRMYEMFLGPLEQSKPWDTNGIEGVSRFIRKFWKLFHDEQLNFCISEEVPTAAELKVLHKTIRKIQEDIERFSFNTAVSSFMICTSELADLKCNKRAILQELVILISSYAPHIADELWHLLGNSGSVCNASFPVYNPQYTFDNTCSYAVSFNGKTRFLLELPVDMMSSDVEKAVLTAPEAQKWLEGKTPRKVIIVPMKIVNVVV